MSRPATPEERAANTAALAEIKQLFPTLPDATVSDFLMGCTPYPFASLTDCLPGLRTLAAKAEGEWEKALLIACEEFLRSTDDLGKHVTPGMTLTISIGRASKKWAVFKDDFELVHEFTPYTDEEAARQAAHDWIGEQNWGEGTRVEVLTVYPKITQFSAR